MTKGSSKGLTWGTLLAGIVSAFALTAIGCIKPMASPDSASRFGASLPGSPDAGRAQPGFLSRESAQRGGDNRPAVGAALNCSPDQ